MTFRAFLRFSLFAAVGLACNLPSVLSTNDPASANGSIIINEVMPNDGDGQFAWAELRSTSQASIPLAGGLLVSRAGDAYTFPDELPEVPAGAFVVVLFDGQSSGADEYDFGDDRVVLHSDSNMVNPFEDAGDELALFMTSERSAENIADYVAWGQPPENEVSAEDVGLWLGGSFVNHTRGGETDGTVEPGVSLGLYPNQPQGFIDSWVVYASADASQGAANDVPATEVLIPSSDALLLAQDFRLAWYNVPFAEEYRLQIDDSQDFSSPESDLTLAEANYAPSQPPADGTYYWRVQAIDSEGREGPFSPAAVVSVASVEPLVLPSEPIEGGGVFPAQQAGTAGPNVLTALSSGRSSQPASFWEVSYLNGLRPVLQRKDSDLICWDGDKELGPRNPWDDEHPDGPGNHSRHGRNYCARASIAMINHYYGGDLTQDRITYEHFGGDGWPVGDLGHDKPLTITGGRDLLRWSLNNTGVTLTMGKPTFAQIQGWAAEGRAVMAGIPGHAIVLRGWAVYNGTNPSIPRGTQFVIYNDPWDGAMHAQSYNSLRLTNTRVPGGTPTGRMQEASVTDDADSDGIMSFDETKRFRTNAAVADTDMDCINDKQDMHSYLYEPHDTYNGSFADKDGDGAWKQEDADNDNGSIIDGDEDANRDGHLNDGETNNFDMADDRQVGVCRPVATPSPTPTEPPTAEPTLMPTSTPAPISGTYDADVTVTHDPAQHDTDSVCYICMPRSILLDVVHGSLSISGPHPWVEVTGDLADDGSFSLSGTGTVAGFPNISVAMEGTLTAAGLAADYTMGAAGGLPTGQAIVYRVVGLRIQPEQPIETGDETINSFVETLNAAFDAGDVNALMDLLHPAVFELYGSEACQSYLNGVIDNPLQVEVVSVTGPADWTWERDGVSLPISDAYTVQADVTAQGQTTRAEIHYAVRPDGSIGWFTDCGEPQ